MKFLALYTPEEKLAGTPPSQEHMAEMGELIDRMTKAGTLLATGGLMPSSKGGRLRLSQGRLTVTDGPYAEAKEVVAGFALLEAKSKDAAIDMAKNFLSVAGDGECEIRQVAHDSNPGS